MTGRILAFRLHGLDTPLIYFITQATPPGAPAARFHMAAQIPRRRFPSSAYWYARQAAPAAASRYFLDMLLGIYLMPVSWCISYLRAWDILRLASLHTHIEEPCYLRQALMNNGQFLCLWYFRKGPVCRPPISDHQHATPSLLHFISLRISISCNFSLLCC